MAPDRRQSCIFHGLVWHRRVRVDGTSSNKSGHAFRVHMPWVCLDLDELAEAGADHLWPLMCVDGSRSAPLSFRVEDHLRSFGGGMRFAKVGETPVQTLARAVRELIAGHAPGGTCPDGRLKLVTHLRHFGYTFNPLSVYYIVPEDGDEIPAAAVIEVSNTPWNEEHVYVISDADTLRKKFLLRKEFHVSPFNPMNQRMAWTLRCPGRTLKMHVDLIERLQTPANPTDDARVCPALTTCPPGADEPMIFNAGVQMDRARALDWWGALWLLCVFPLLPQVVQWRIHFQAAMLLFVRKVKFWPHPKGTTTAGSRAVATVVKKGPVVVGVVAVVLAVAYATEVVAVPVLVHHPPVDKGIALASCASTAVACGLITKAVRKMTEKKAAAH